MAKNAKSPKAEQSSGRVPAVVEKLVRPVLEGMGFSVWDVRFDKEGAMWYLKVLIDHADGSLMDTDACEAATRAIDPLLDEADPIEQSYCLEVGSPGLGRRLSKPAHFEWAVGKKVSAGLYAPDSAGRKEVAGVLESFSDGVAVLKGEDGEEISLPVKSASLVKLRDDEDLFN